MPSNGRLAAECGQPYESSANLEKMPQLLQVAASYALTDPEIVRLRSRAQRYEMYRTGRRRRILFAYLAIQLVLVTVTPQTGVGGSSPRRSE